MTAGAYISPHAGRVLFGDHAREWMKTWNTEATTTARDASGLDPPSRITPTAS